MRQYRTKLAGIVPPLWLNRDDLGRNHASWIQSPDYWTLFFLEHKGGITVNSRTYPFSNGSVALVGPGSKAGFLKTGPGTGHLAFTFGLREGSLTVGLPTIADLGERKDLRREEAYSALEWLPLSIGRGLAFVHNLLWDLALPPGELRSSDVLQELEQFVRAKISERFSVAALAAELGVSQSQLLRLVRAEYGGTIQGFVRERRIEAARTLIASTDLPFKSIAAQTGLADLQTLNKAIRGATGLSPRALRSIAHGQSRQVVSIRP